MVLKIGIGIVVALVLFLAFVSTREGKFRYERSGLIKAPADQIFPYISNFRLGNQWSPYQMRDPNMKSTFTGADGQVGSMMEFQGNSEVGAGKLELLKVTPPSEVHIKLTMLKPFFAENLVEYRLVPEADGTRFFWIMSGDGGFMGKLMNTLIDCEKMVAGDFEKGIANLKVLIESQK